MTSYPHNGPGREALSIEHTCEADFEDLLRVHIESWRSTYAGVVADSFLTDEVEPVFRA